MIRKTGYPACAKSAATTRAPCGHDRPHTTIHLHLSSLLIDRPCKCIVPVFVLPLSFFVVLMLIRIPLAPTLLRQLRCTISAVLGLVMLASPFVRLPSAYPTPLPCTFYIPRSSVSSFRAPAAAGPTTSAPATRPTTFIICVGYAEDWCTICSIAPMRWTLPTVVNMYILILAHVVVLLSTVYTYRGCRTSIYCIGSLWLGTNITDT